MAKETEWIDTFEIYLSSALDPANQSKLKQEYITWVKSRGNYYATLKDVAPEFLSLLNVLEKNLAIKVELEEPKEPKKEKEEK